MSTEFLLGAWIGDMRGSLVANLFVNITNSSGKCEIDLRVNAGGIITVFRGGMIPEETGQHPIAELTAVPVGTNVASGLKLFLQFEIIEQYRLQGRWSLSDGNAGIFYFASTQNAATQADEGSTRAPAPIQIVQQTKTLPTLTLYRDEVKELIAKMKSLLPTSYEVVVRVNAAENKELRRLSPAFWEAPSLPRKTEWLNLYLTEPTSGTARSITINLSPSDCSYSVSGPEDIWVTGAFHELRTLLSSKHSWWRYAFERYALNLNGIALLLALTLSPDLSLGPRIALLFVTICLILIVKWLYDQTASVRVFLKSDFSEAKYIDFPRLLTTLAGALIIALVTGTYRILGDGTVQAWLEWLTSKQN